MTKGRLEAFSDGVIAIIITIMVLELKVPHGADWEDLEPLVPVFASYVVSFTYIGIYWNNHHHLLHASKRIDARVMWMNLHLLFWLSLTPVVTAWVGEHPRASAPAAMYGVVLLGSAFAWNFLSRAIARLHSEAEAAAVLGPRGKGSLSQLLYAGGIALAFVHPWLADGAYVAVAVMWFIPDRRIEAHVDQEHAAS